jgi:hypothetical protein
VPDIVPSAGTLVANDRIDRTVELTSLFDDLAASGRTPSTRVITAEVSHASDQVADALQLPERALVMSLERIRLAARSNSPGICTGPPGTRSPPACPGPRPSMANPRPPTAITRP